MMRGMDHESELTLLRNKIADLEDRSRCNNIKFRGVPETVATPELPAYLLRLMKTLTPDLSDTELMLDTAHHLPNRLFCPPLYPGMH